MKQNIKDAGQLSKSQRVEGFALAAGPLGDLHLCSFYPTQAEAESAMNASTDSRELRVVPAEVRIAENGNIRHWRSTGESVAQRKMPEAQRDAIPQWVAGAFDVFREKYDKQRCKKLGVSDWKEALRLLWYRGADDQESNGGILRSIRNHPEGLGYRWLDEYPLKAPQIAATQISGALSTQDARRLP